MTASPRWWFGLGLSSAVLVHVAAVLMIATASLPALRSWTQLRDALPSARLVIAAIAAVSSVALVIAAATRRLAWRRALLGSAASLAIASTGLLYGCAKTAHVEARPVVTAADDDGHAVFDHAAFDRVLARFVDDKGMVDYQALVAERALLDEYVGQLATSSPRSHPALFPTRDHATAYWINAYNALAMRAVIDHYPVESVKDIMVAYGVFNRLQFPVGGAAMTLDDIEKGILLKELDDPRVHFALTCASMSCPHLDRTAFRAEGLSERLDAEGRDFLQSPNGVEIDAARRRVRLSKYFHWYREDFGDDHLAFVVKYLSEPQRAALAELRARGGEVAIEHMEYDWRLNDQRAPWRQR